MFRILLIVGLLLAGAQQSLARGNIELTETASEIEISLWQTGTHLSAEDPAGDPATADTTPSYCKSSDCKAVIGSLVLTAFRTHDNPDTTKPVRRHSVAARLEPRPPNT